MLKRVPIVFMVVLVILLTASLLQARVFSSSSVDFSIPSSFGRLIYKTVMEINEGKAEVSVVACDAGLMVNESLKNAQRDGALRLVALSPAADKPRLVVTVVQSKADRTASAVQRARHRLADVPVPAEGVMLGVMQNPDTRTTLERLTVRQGAGEVIQFYEQEMTRAGWGKLLGAGAGGGILCYVKGVDICVVRVAVQESNGETGITLLHKQGAIN